ncbi:MAG TPA: hypothetical protein VI197_17015 [Polyangiaceae bacterium]
MTASHPRQLSELRPTHLPVTADDLHSEHPGGRLMYLPGSPERAASIGDQFVDRRVVPGTRGFDVHLGVLRFDGRAVDVGAVATGMGCPSLDIVVTELLALGARRFLRVGTAGTLSGDRVKTADVVIATGSVRDAAACDAYAPREVPAIANVELVLALKQAAHRLALDTVTHVGLVHTKDSLYAREYGYGPLAERHAQYMAVLERCGVLASEMEAAQLFLLAQVYSSAAAPVAAGCVLGIVGDTDALGAEGLRHVAEERAVSIALEAARLLPG